MTTTTVYAGTNDGWVRCIDPSAALAREGTGGFIDADAAGVELVSGQFFDTADYHVYESFVSFDTSAIDDADTVSAVVPSLWVLADASVTNFDVQMRVHNWGATVTTADFVAGTGLSAKTLAATFATSGFTVGAYAAGTESGNNLKNAINLTGTAYFLLNSSRHASASTPTVDEIVSFAPAETGGTTNDAKLVITHAPGRSAPWLSANLPNGTYDMYLSFRPTAPSPQDDARFFIRPANTDVSWGSNPGVGRINLKHDIVIGGGTPGTDNVTYTADGSAILNPGQGFYKLYVYPDYGADFDASGHDTEMVNFRTSHFKNVVLLIFNFQNFKGSDTLPQSFLDMMTNSYNALRNIGMMCINGFVYDYNGSSPNDVPFSRMNAHLDQVAPIANANKDVIWSYELRLMGQYGELYNSTNYGSDSWGIEENNGPAKTQVLQKFLDTFEDRHVAIRYVRHMRYWLNDEDWAGDGTSPDPGNPRVTQPERLTTHIDSFLANSSYGGTWQWDDQGGDFRGDEAWLKSLMAIGGRSGMGETENFGWGPTEWAANFTDLELLRFAALSEDGAYQAVGDWYKANNHPTHSPTLTYWEVAKRYLGYRLRLDTAALPDNAAAGADIPISIVLTNLGYAAPLIPYEVVITLRNQSGGAEYEWILDEDITTWTDAVTITQTLTVDDVPPPASQAAVRAMNLMRMRNS